MALRYAGVEQINFMIVVDKPDVDKARCAQRKR